MSKYTVDALSLSHIGDLLRDRLGDNASQYLFPDDFEKAIVDIGFTGLVIDGDANPYDEIIFIGNASEKMIRTGRSDLAGPSLVKYKKATFINATSIAEYCFDWQNDLTDVVFCDGITSIGKCAFRNCTSLTKDIVLPSGVTILETQVFANSGITSIDGVGVTGTGTVSANSGGSFSNCSNLKIVSLPKLTNLTGSTTRGTFYKCSGLKTVQLGSIGYGVTFISTYAFQDCTSTFTITIYAEGSNVDTLVTNVRSSCANATIVVKASTDTVYGGTSYSAGDTIKTSTP